MKKKNSSYKKMWLLLAALVVSAVVASLAFTSLIYAVSSLLGGLLIAGGALFSLVGWTILVVLTLERAYEPGRPVSLPTSGLQGDLKSSIAKS
jgi:hypothetical protein